MTNDARGRLHRFNFDGLIYHVSTATRDRRPIFADSVNAAIVADAIQFLRTERAQVLAYVVMPDHVHMLLVPRPPRNLSRVMQALKGYTARLINKRLAMRDSLWQQSYYDRIIRGERQLQETIDYIEQNPLKAGLCDDPKAYAFSSAGRPELTDLLEYLGG